MSADDIIDQLLAQLGPAVLIPNRYGTKIPTPKAWQKKTLKDMESGAYRAKFKGCNVGVSLGKPSLGLCSIDIDDDVDVPAFLGVNPDLKLSLQSRGVRGRNVWFRVRGEYPNQVIPLKTHSNKMWGEWRSTGGQTVIYGMHPSGVQYQRNTHEPFVISFNQIVWPSVIANPPMNTEEPLEFDETEESGGEVAGPNGPCLSPVSTIEDAVRLATPTEIHTNNECLFRLARGVLTLEIRNKQKFTPAQLDDVFLKWYEEALPFLDPGQSQEDYLIQFLNSYKYAKHPLGNYVVPKALELAKSQPMPPEAERFKNPDLQLLVGLCKQLQINAGDKPFYLSCRSVAGLFGHPNHSTAASWLTMLVVLQILEEVEPGTTKRATRYRYKGKL